MKTLPTNIRKKLSHRYKPGEGHQYFADGEEVSKETFQQFKRFNLHGEEVPTNTKKKKKWFEYYKKCGCIAISLTKKELLGYCEKHGTDRAEIYKIYE